MLLFYGVVIWVIERTFLVNVFYNSVFLFLFIKQRSI